MNISADTQTIKVDIPTVTWEADEDECNDLPESLEMEFDISDLVDEGICTEDEDGGWELDEDALTDAVDTRLYEEYGVSAADFGCNIEEA